MKPKLVRDKIPQIINTNNGKCQVKILNNAEYKQALKVKLREEAQEVFETDNKQDLVEEIADVYEVIEAIIQANNLSLDEINAIKKNKAQIKGKFVAKLQLISLDTREEEILELPLKESDIINQAEDFLRKEVLPQAHLLDQDSQLLKDTLDKFNQFNPLFLKLKIAEKWGGLAMGNLGFYTWQIMMAKYSGAFAFLQTQHQSAIASLNSSNNEILKEKYLSKIGQENHFYGVGFSHLRRQGSPLVTATLTEKGYELNGFIPWITGYDIFSHFIIGATLPDGQELYGMIPFRCQTPYLELSQRMSLCAMISTNTVTGKLNNYLLSKEDIISIKPVNSIHHKDQENVLHHGFFPLGCTFASLEIIAENLTKLNYYEVKDTYFNLKNKAEILQAKMLKAVLDPSANFHDKLKLRTQAIHLAYQGAIASIITSKGVANINDHPANRIYREALVYGVSGQTLEVLKESIQF